MNSIDRRNQIPRFNPGFMNPNNNSILHNPRDGGLSDFQTVITK